MALSSRDASHKRAQRTRTRLRKLANGRPRRSVFRSSKNIYAQVIDDERGVTLAAASSLEGGEKKAKGADAGGGVLVRALDLGLGLRLGLGFAAFQRGGGGERHAALVVDDLGIDVLRRAEDRQTRPAIRHLAQPGAVALGATLG
jgi:large subunit ribosomal protein L18